MAYRRTSPQPVIEGGTGDQSFTVYAPITGGTTSTGALQSADSGISNVGYILTSNGNASLPTWQANSGGGFPAVTTFTPTISCTGISGITYATQYGAYTQSGKVVFIFVRIGLSNKGAGVAIGAPEINGSWPMGSSHSPVTLNVYYEGFNLTPNQALYGAWIVTNTILPLESTTTQSVGVDYAQYTNTSFLAIAGTYFVD